MKTKLILQALPQAIALWLLLILSVNVNSAEGDVGMVAMEQIPYGFESDDGQITGVIYDLLKEIRAASGVGLAVDIEPAKRLLATLFRGKRTCTIVVNSPEIVDVLDVVEPIGFTITAGILPVAGIKLEDYSDLAGKLIAVPLGIQFDEKFHNDNSLNKISTPQYINAIKMMRAGRVDAVAGAISVLKYIAGQEGLMATFFDKPLVFAESDFYLVCSFKLSKNERAKLQQAVIKLRSNGKIQEILGSYFNLPKQ